MLNKPLSANSLFHFTSKLEILHLIIKRGIYVRYSLETYGGILKTQNELVLPMACFCDIPLSNVSDHVLKYGKYGIGLTKDWGMRHGLSPVIYTHKKSHTAQILNDLMSDASSFLDIDDVEENKKYQSKKRRLTKREKDLLQEKDLEYLVKAGDVVTELQSQIGHFMKYIKPYEGIGHSNGKRFNKVRFYDEKEWRYVPPKELLQKVEIKDIYKREFYKDPVKRRYINIKLAKHKKLTFKPKDIRYILVSKNNEIPPMIDFIHNAFSNIAVYNDLRMLYSRIISLEQIESDF